MGFTSLNHYLDRSWLFEAYRRVRRDGAVGVDGQTAEDYQKDLWGNLKSLLERAKSGTYQAPPVRRAYVPKGAGTGEMRPIGIPTFEDKILQRAVQMVLEPLYEQDFYDCSYGFRPGRSAHDALDALWHNLMAVKGGWVLEVDIRQFFDSLDHACLRELVGRRVRDGVLLRLLGKWLKAGVWEEGRTTHPTTGSPQGGVISPLLANIYLHYVLDEWFEWEVKPRLAGRASLVRYADDFVMVFACEEDARRVQGVLPKRFGKFGLTVHPEKTRLVPFARPSGGANRGEPGSGNRPGTFDFLGFTHYWGVSRKGNGVVKRKTASGRLSRTIKRIGAWCRANRHRPIPEQHEALSQKLHGHDAYYGLTGNYRCLQVVRLAVVRVWRKWLCRRSWHTPSSWASFGGMLERFPLPAPEVVHSVYRT
jgi:group II intron reverse transcriptase/maturase